MSTIRKARESKGFAMSRALAQDSGLTFEARGMMAYLLSKPTDWKAQLHDLERAGGIGRDQRIRIVAELEKAGYIERAEVRMAGRIDYEMLVHEEPLADDKRTGLTRRTPQAKPPSTELPRTEKPDAVSADAYMNREVQEEDLHKRNIRSKEDISSVQSHAAKTSPDSRPCPKCNRASQIRNGGLLVKCEACGIVAIDAEPKKKPKPAPKDYYLPPDEFTAIFLAAYVREYGFKYIANGGDCQQYSRLLKQRGGELNLDNWNRAVTNYFMTPRKDHRVTELCASFAGFAKHPLDGYGKPQNSTPQRPKTQGEINRGGTGKAVF